MALSDMKIKLELIAKWLVILELNVNKADRAVLIPEKGSTPVQVHFYDQNHQSKPNGNILRVSFDFKLTWQNQIE